MRFTLYLGCTLIAATFGGAARAANPVNICQAPPLTCATTMPVGGFCECSSHGQSHDGTVVPKGTPHGKVDSTAGGCGDHPGAPGCK
jgi:hypothetical protein